MTGVVAAATGTPIPTAASGPAVQVAIKASTSWSWPSIIGTVGGAVGTGASLFATLGQNLISLTDRQWSIITGVLATGAFLALAVSSCRSRNAITPKQLLALIAEIKAYDQDLQAQTKGLLEALARFQAAETAIKATETKIVADAKTIAGETAQLKQVGTALDEMKKQILEKFPEMQTLLTADSASNVEVVAQFTALSGALTALLARLTAATETTPSIAIDVPALTTATKESVAVTASAAKEVVAAAKKLNEDKDIAALLAALQKAAADRAVLAEKLKIIETKLGITV